MRVRSLLAATIFFAISAPACADGPISRAARIGPVSSAYNWTGTYVGIHAGSGWAVPDLHLIPTGQVIPGPRPDGPIVGGQLGVNYQFGAWVIGGEAELSWANVEGSTNIMERH
jgi:outer membrane immunogenic protein